MADVSSVSTTQSLAQTLSGTGNDTLGKEEFLLLLTTQLKNQDPMNPMDNTEFVAQLSQFSSLEQLWNINESIGQNNDLTLSVNNTLLTQLIGKEIRFASDTFYQGADGVTSEIGFNLAQSGNIQVEIRDADDQLVRTLNAGLMPAGEQRIQWDGKSDLGETVADGPYSVRVVYQKDGGQTVDLNSYMIGHVDGVQVADGQPMLFVGDQPVNPSIIISVFETK